MKKITAGILAIGLSILMAATVLANPADMLQNMMSSMEEGLLASADGTTDSLSEEEAEELLSQLAELFGDSESDSAGEQKTLQEVQKQNDQTEQPGESAGGQGESEGGQGESPDGESGGDAQEMEEPDGSGIPKDEPVSTTGTTYGYEGVFQIDTASSEQVNLSDGEWDINDAQMIFWGGSVIQNSGNSSLVVRDSYVRGETAVETAPLAGNPGNLLVAGNIRTTLALGNSENIYINSTIVSRNWASLSTDGAEPALEEGQKELSLYAYGSEAITMDGGYGAYSDLFCNLYSYGSHIQAAEIGIISGTYGNVVVGTIEDGEQDPAVAAVLKQADRDRRADKQLPSVIEGGRNAIMIHSVNLPPYWEYEGYSQEELPLYHTSVMVHGSTLRTDLSLDKNVEYEAQKQAYINHGKGSVILVKSTNADIYLNDCEIIADPEGTGYLLQTVYNNDTMFMNAVPDGETYPGVVLTMNHCQASGDIAHEDYQRDLYLILIGTALEGSMNEYDCAHWNQVSAAEGFTDYCLDASYNTHHGLQVVLQNGSVWNVTQESHLSRLSFTEDSQINGMIYVDGVQCQNLPGEIYEGNVVVVPGTPEAETTPEEPAATPEEPAGTPEEPETTLEEPAAIPEEPATQEEPVTEHVHNWVSNGGYPSDCVHKGKLISICTVCGEEYTEYIGALGHNWVYSDELSEAPTCVKDGTAFYTCIRCGEYYTETVPATGHNWVSNGGYPSDCVHEGKLISICTVCGEEYTEYIEPLGHNWIWDLDNSVWPDCENDGYYFYYCDRENCTETYTEYWPALGHDWVYDGTVYADCMNAGYDVYTCPRCGLYDNFNYVEPIGHVPDWSGYTYDDVYHYYTCTYCGEFIAEPHTWYDPCFCGHTGPVG